MHLKTLTIKGFKSFASSTTLRLEPGITAVVGPNGSGKSNVVDALTWVMGEQGAKNLRGGSMADVIFAGAGSRPALGRAEVSLTIDNTDGALPIDYTEVTITRTLFRGGGSEYQINGTPCRLLDVQELLSDTGLGRQMHVIVGQGQLDAVLSATPEERRGFIEEAAGVLKHRRRKERALRKLDSMAADLTRVTDLATELRRQLGPLARQAAVARRARSIQVEVRDATARLLADDVAQAQSLLEAGQADAGDLARRRAAAAEAERQARAQLAELAATDATSGRRLARATTTWEELSGEARALTSLSEVAGERVRLLTQTRHAVQGTDPEELDRRAQNAATEEAELADAVEAARSTLADANRERVDAEAADSAAEAALSSLQRRQAEHRERIARTGGRVASARSRHEAAQAALEQARKSLEAASGRAQTAAQALLEAGGERGTEAEQAADAVELTPEQAQAAQAQAVHDEATAALASARDAVASANEARREAAADVATWTARRDTLALSLRSKDGTGALIEAAPSGMLGPLAEQLRIKRGWENAVAALLGELAGAALISDADAAGNALELAREQDAGQVRLVLATGEVPGLESSAVEALAQNIADAAPTALPARELVTVTKSAVAKAPALAALLDRLLGGAVVVTDLAAANALRQAVPAAVVATQAGDVLAPGWVTGAGRGASSILELTAAHEEAVAEAESAAAAETEAAAAVEAARAAEDEARQGLSEALAQLRRADAEAARAAEEVARLASAARAASEEEGRAKRVLERAEQELTTRTAELSAASAALSALEEPAGQAEDEEAVLAKARQAREAAAAAATQARAAETEARLTLRTAEERERSSRGRAQSLRSAARREREARAQAERAEARRLARLRVATHVRDQAALAAQAAAQSVTAALAERRRLDEERSQTTVAINAVREQIDQHSRELASLTDAAHREEVARAEQRMRLEALGERALAELGMNLEDLVEEYGPHMPVPEALAEEVEAAAADQAAEGEQTGENNQSGGADSDAGAAPQDETGGAAAPASSRGGRPFVRAEQEKRLARAQRDLAKLGKVNPLALEEHAALEQRHQFLATQLDDLKRSRADLLRIVEEIDARVLEVFSAAFADTAVQFAGVFDRLFPGGEGRLVLTDPNDLLTTGIEIEARPAGKKVKRLSLLSGGERSLAAVALLVAIFKARPSPFYVMDEVEAALDDTNLGRLLEIFTELRESSQLIIITHQKRTMEVADALYGITMREGVTKAVSQRLAQTKAATTGT
ncbi:chromosome segregation protein SMC [Actinomyces bovis]|uniref:chromosome segregation protein SMC n=1 Tax=Actinomyces bovis TaxID=1658 RepID=UPI000DCF959E|nr:chromosome segregation protein SMC [Actinomyces bovis]